ncbi:hypothetical protein ABBQ32_007158 [Trebouxia sp. C0010 RCD-2024]
MAHALYWGMQILFTGRPLPDISSKDAYYRNYTCTTSPKPTSLMAPVVHADALREGYRKAGYAPNAQITHRARHKVPTDLRINHDVSSDELSVLGGWNVSVKNQVYARPPTGTLLAKMSGCPSRQGYIVYWLLLDPGAMAEFSDMTRKIYPTV